MSRVGDLYALQEMDLDLAERRATLDRVLVQLGDGQDLAARRDELALQHARLAQLEAQQRDLELQDQEQQEHIARVEGRLYGGTVGNPRELTSLQDDLEQLRAARNRLDDQLLEVMAAIEELQAALRAETQALAVAERDWQGLQEQLTQQRDELSDTITALTARRDMAVAHVDHRDLALYEALAQTRQGQAVARVERGMCLACRITQPLSVIQRIRGGQEVVQCTSCQRMLYAG